jgi:hypothetical protein
LPRKAVEAVTEANGKGHDSGTYDKRYECYKCHKMGHPATHCGKNSNSNDDDDSSAAAKVKSVKKLQKDIKSMRKAFTMVNTQLEKLKEAESDISESEGEDEASHFQMDVALQFAQVEKEFEPRIVKLFKQAVSKIKLDLRDNSFGQSVHYGPLLYCSLGKQD